MFIIVEFPHRASSITWRYAYSTSQWNSACARFGLFSDLIFCLC